MSSEEGVIYVSACCVCKLVLYDKKMITESQLKKVLGGLPYRLTHTYLSKACLEQYFDDVCNGQAYLSLADKCVEHTKPLEPSVDVGVDAYH